MIFYPFSSEIVASSTSTSILSYYQDCSFKTTTRTEGQACGLLREQLKETCRRRRLSGPEQRLGLGPFATRGNRICSTRIQGTSKQVPTKFQEACHSTKCLRTATLSPSILTLLSISLGVGSKNDYCESHLYASTNALLSMFLPLLSGTTSNPNCPTLTATVNHIRPTGRPGFFFVRCS
jgi:hypothetical protein